MAFTQLFNILNMRSMRRSVFKIGLFSNPYVVWALILSVGLQFLAMYVLYPVFNLVHLNLLEITLIIIGSSFVLWIGELYKYLRYRDLY
jgi:Ca2+-transporting ATPase